MRVIHFIFLVISFYSLLSQAIAQVNFTASISPGKIGMNDYATLRYTVQGSLDIQHIYPPDFNEMQLVSGPNSEASEIKSNGRVEKTFSFLFVLKPLKPGKVKFSGARAKVAGKEYVSNAVVIQVMKSPHISNDEFAQGSEIVDDGVLKEGEDIEEKVRENMLLRLETNKNEVYVGEPVVAEFKLYSRLKSNSRLTQNPSFNGFSVIDLQAPEVTESGSGKINGKDYNVYTIRKVLLFPLQPGTFTIEQLELENHVQFVQQMQSGDVYDLFSMLNRGYGNTVSELVTLTSRPSDIMVKPLPEKDKPANFTGAVGKYSISARLVQDNFRTDEEGRLIVEISGEGNLQLVNPPSIHWPIGVDAFDPTIRDTMNTEVLPVSGKKTFEYVFSVNRPGSYALPAIFFSYFDPGTSKYITAQSETVMFNVAPPLETKNIVLKSPEKRNNSWFVWFLIPAVLGAVTILFVVLRSLRKEQKAIPVNSNYTEPVTDTISLPETPLEKSSEICMSGNNKDFYPVLNQELKGWLAVKFGLGVNETSLDRLRERMDEANIPNKTVLETQSLLREIEWQLYSPANSGLNMHEHLARASLLIQEITGCSKDA